MVRLAKLHPDVLIFPEFGRSGYYSATGVYAESRTGGKVKTGEDVRAFYPEAMTVWKLGDVDFPVEWDGLLDGALAGDIHLFRAWFGDAPNFFFAQLQHEVDYIKASKSLKLEGDWASQLASPDPKIRYLAVNSLSQPDAAQTALLLKAIES